MDSPIPTVCIVKPHLPALMIIHCKVPKLIERNEARCSPCSHVLYASNWSHARQNEHASSIEIQFRLWELVPNCLSFSNPFVEGSLSFLAFMHCKNIKIKLVTTWQRKRNGQSRGFIWWRTITTVAVIVSLLWSCQQQNTEMFFYAAWAYIPGMLYVWSHCFPTRLLLRVYTSTCCQLLCRSYCGHRTSVTCNGTLEAICFCPASCDVGRKWTGLGLTNPANTRAD